MNAIEARTPRPWMKPVLLAAAAYNVLWGAWAVLAPLAMFRLAGFDPLPTYPQLWQCIGMIVGVYGVGYAIAAFDPYRHWPIVLVGLLGKIFGPIGFAWSVFRGDFPAAMGWTILTNDLIWWLPFSAILWHAARAAQIPAGAATAGDASDLAQLLGQYCDQNGRSLAEQSQQSPALVTLLRHSGCVFCRQALSDLHAKRAEIEQQGVTLALVHMGPNDDPMFAEHGLGDVPRFSDPEGRLYAALQLEQGTLRQLFGWRTWWLGFKAWLAGHKVGKLVGNGFQMPGVVLLHHGRVVRAYRHQSAGERPDYADLACEFPAG